MRSALISPCAPCYTLPLLPLLLYPAVHASTNTLDCFIHLPPINLSHLPICLPAALQPGAPQAFKVRALINLNELLLSDERQLMARQAESEVSEGCCTCCVSWVVGCNCMSWVWLHGPAGGRPCRRLQSWLAVRGSHVHSCRCAHLWQFWG